MSSTAPWVTRRTGPRPAQVLVRRGPWTTACDALYRERQCDAVEWRWTAPKVGRSAEALAGLPGLRSLDVTLKRVDDSVIGDLRDLNELSLGSATDNPLDLSALEKLRFLVVESTQDREISGVGRLPSLKVLRLFGFRHPSLQGFVGDNPKLETVTVEAKDPVVTAATGVGGLAALDLLRMENVVVSEIESAAACARLRSLDLAGPQDDGRTLQDRRHPLDVSAFAGHGRIEWISIVRQGRLRGAEAFLECPAVRGVNLSEDSLDDAEWARLRSHPGFVFTPDPAGGGYFERREPEAP